MKSPGENIREPQAGAPQGPPPGQPPVGPPQQRSILPMDPNQPAQLGDQPRMEGPPPLLQAGAPPAAPGAPGAPGATDKDRLKLAMIMRLQKSKDIGQQRNAVRLGGNPSDNIGYTGG